MRGDSSLSGYVDESSENTAAEPWQDKEIRPPPARILDIADIDTVGQRQPLGISDRRSTRIFIV